jgi:hypothetical protein
MTIAITSWVHMYKFQNPPESLPRKQSQKISKEGEEQEEQEIRRTRPSRRRQSGIDFTKLLFGRKIFGKIFVLNFGTKFYPTNNI